MPLPDDHFEINRAALRRLAYRMLGSLNDADDVLQEAYLRWTRVSSEDVESPRAYLFTIVTRLCIDQREAIDTRKLTYVGPWLPEPVVEAGASDPGERTERAESVSLALLFVLESLSPVERAAYLLRKIFDYDYAVIAGILDKSEANCRQLVSRAEGRIQERRPRFDPDPADAQRLADKFLEACATGDLAGLVELLSADAVLYGDGGGKAQSALAPIRGAGRIARFFLGVIKKFPAELRVHRVRVNGQPGFAGMVDGHLEYVLTFDVAGSRIVSCFIVRNPDKLRGIVVDSP